MRLRSSQISTLSLSMSDDADHRLVKYARIRFPDHFRTVSNEAIRGLIADVRRNAARHQVVEPDIVKAFDLSVMYGLDFYDAPWAQDVFRIRDWPASAKLDAVCQRVRRRIPEF